MAPCPYCGRPIPYGEGRCGDPACCGGWRTLGDRMRVGLLSEDGLFHRGGAEGVNGPAPEA